MNKLLLSAVVSSAAVGAINAPAFSGFTWNSGQVFLEGGEFVFFSGMLQGTVTGVSFTVLYTDGSPSAEADDLVWSFSTPIGTGYIGGTDSFSMPPWFFMNEWDFFGNSTQSGLYTHEQALAFMANTPKFVTLGLGNGWDLGPECGYQVTATFFGNCTFTPVPGPGAIPLIGLAGSTLGLGSIPVFGGRRRRR